MKRIAAIVLLIGSLACAAPKDGVVRMKSHGCSGTVVWTGQGRSVLISCAHAFEGQDRHKRISVEAPSPTGGQQGTTGIRLLAVRYDLDLSLIELPAGPLPYVCPIAPRGHRHGRCISVGYDSMRLPGTVAGASVLGSSGRITYTREKPWPGRSGGALIDSDSGWLIGTVQGYEVLQNGRGMYSSLEAIHTFLGPNWPRPSTQPQYRNFTSPLDPDGGGPYGGAPLGTAPNVPWREYRAAPVRPSPRSAPQCPT